MYNQDYLWIIGLKNVAEISYLCILHQMRLHRKRGRLGILAPSINRTALILLKSCETNLLPEYRFLTSDSGSFKFEFSSRFSPIGFGNGFMMSDDEPFFNGQIRPTSHLKRPWGCAAPFFGSVRGRIRQRERQRSEDARMLQGYDFLHLFRDVGVNVQIGGNDQWGNITADTDLI